MAEVTRSLKRAAGVKLLVKSIRQYYNGHCNKQHKINRVISSVFIITLKEAGVTALSRFLLTIINNTIHFNSEIMI